MNIELSNLVEDLSDSATLAVADKARELRAQGVDVVSFGAGEPDFDTPQHIKDAAVAALAAGDTKYVSPTSGKTELREAICDYTRRYCQVEYHPDQICVTCGGKDALYMALAAVINPGDEVIVPVPYWVSYPEQARMLGGKPVFVAGEVEHGGRLDPRRLAEAITPRTRVCIINSPSNPTGYTYSRAELEAIAEVLRPTNVIVFSDEIYHRLYFGEEPPTSFAALDGMHERTLTFSGASKSFAMTGWRIGYAAGAVNVIQAMTRVQSQTTSGPASFVQSAFIAALTGDQECVEAMRRSFKARGEKMHAALEALPGVTCVKPTGAFYAFCDVSGTFSRLGVTNAAEFAQVALQRAHVAVVPGNAFGWDTHVRFSFATSEAVIDEGMRRMGEFLKG